MNDYGPEVGSDRPADYNHTVGRHVSPAHRRSLRGAVAAALAGVIVLVGAAGFAGYGIWTRAHDPVHSVRHVSAPATTPTPTPTHPPTVAFTVTGPSCQIFVSVPGGDILVNRVFTRGESAQFDDPRLNVVLSDASAVRVYVNGHLRPPGRPGARAEFDAARP